MCYEKGDSLKCVTSLVGHEKLVDQRIVCQGPDFKIAPALLHSKKVQARDRVSFQTVETWNEAEGKR